MSLGYEVGGNFPPPFEVGGNFPPPFEAYEVGGNFPPPFLCPDKNPSDKEKAEENFKRVTEAYEVGEFVVAEEVGHMR